MYNAQHPVTGQSYVLESKAAAAAILRGDKAMALNAENEYRKAKAEVEKARDYVDWVQGRMGELYYPNPTLRRIEMTLAQSALAKARAMLAKL